MSESASNVPVGRLENCETSCMSRIRQLATGFFTVTLTWVVTDAARVATVIADNLHRRAIYSASANRVVENCQPMRLCHFAVTSRPVGRLASGRVDRTSVSSVVRAATAVRKTVIRHWAWKRAPTYSGLTACLQVHRRPSTKRM